MPEITEAEARELAALREAERYRRGEPDPKSGAIHVWALTQGALLRYEYDLGTHGHHDAWELGAVVVDIVELIGVNQARGFAAGDALLRAVAQTLSERFPTSKVVRIHGDAFAMLLPPSAQLPLTEEVGAQAQAALEAQVPERMAAAGHPGVAPRYTVSLVQVSVVQPSHWQVLGPLVWAECERAHVLGRSGQAQGIQRRRIELDAAIPLER